MATLGTGVERWQLWKGLKKSKYEDCEGPQ